MVFLLPSQLSVQQVEDDTPPKEEAPLQDEEAHVFVDQAPMPFYRFAFVSLAFCWRLYFYGNSTLQPCVNCLT